MACCLLKYADGWLPLSLIPSPLIVIETLGHSKRRAWVTTIQPAIPGGISPLSMANRELLLSGDIALNPGPRPADIFPCGHCALPCNWSEQAVMCDACEVWFHTSCHSMSDSVYHCLGSEDSWQCYRCHSILWDTFHSWELSEPDHIHRSASSDDSRQRIGSSTSAPSPSSFRPGTHSTPPPPPPPSPTILVWYPLLVVRCLNTFGLTAGSNPPLGPQPATPYSCLIRRRTGAH